jgi:hypothetical protein
MEKFTDSASISQGLNTETVELTLTKCYHLEMESIVSRIASVNLENLDLTEAVHLGDPQVLSLSELAPNLRFLNISWCNEVTNHSVRAVVERCPRLENLVVNGIKALSDAAFPEYA